MTSSTYTVEHQQVDGRRYVNEVHVDSTGRAHQFSYLAAPGTDYDAVLAQHATMIDEQLAEQEFNEIINS